VYVVDRHREGVDEKVNNKGVGTDSVLSNRPPDSERAQTNPEQIKKNKPTWEIEFPVHYHIQKFRLLLLLMLLLLFLPVTFDRGKVENVWTMSLHCDDTDSMPTSRTLGKIPQLA